MNKPKDENLPMVQTLTPLIPMIKGGLLALCLCLGSIWASQTPQVILINKTKTLEIAIDSQDILKTGSWVAFFSHQLEKKGGEATAGLPYINFKIEGGKLWRHYSGQEWRKIMEIKVVEKKGWQVALIPRKAILPEIEVNKNSPQPKYGIVDWRLAFFPHSAQEPIFFPKEKFGSIDLNQSLDAPPLNQKSFDLEYFLDPADFVGSIFEKALACRSAGKLKLVKNNLSLKPQPRLSREAFNEVSEESIYWPTSEMDSKVFLNKETLIARRLGVSGKMIIFDTLPALKTKALWLKARLQAAEHRNSTACFFAKTPEDIPEGAHGVIFKGLHRELDENIIALRNLREAFEGPLWAWWPKKFSQERSENSLLLINAWLYLGVRPILPPDQLPEELSTEDLVAFCWLDIHLKYQDKNDARLEKIFDIPFIEISRRMFSARKQNFDEYLKRLYAKLLVKFDEQLAKTP